MRKMEIDQEDNNLNEILNSFSDTQPSDVEFTKNCLRISTGKCNGIWSTHFILIKLFKEIAIHTYIIYMQ